MVARSSGVVVALVHDAATVRQAARHQTHRRRGLVTRVNPGTDGASPAVDEQMVLHVGERLRDLDHQARQRYVAAVLPRRPGSSSR